MHIVFFRGLQKIFCLMADPRRSCSAPYAGCSNVQNAKCSNAKNARMIVQSKCIRIISEFSEGAVSAKSVSGLLEYVEGEAFLFSAFSFIVVFISTKLYHILIMRFVKRRMMSQYSNRVMAAHACKYVSLHCLLLYSGSVLASSFYLFIYFFCNQIFANNNMCCHQRSRLLRIFP